VKNSISAIVKTTLLALFLTNGLPLSASAKPTVVTCPESHEGREIFYLIASTKNYQIKICGMTKGSFFMYITRDTKTTIAKVYEDGSFVAKRDGYIYEVVAEGRWNEFLEQSESHPVSFTIRKGQKLIVEEKIIRKSVGGYSLLP
jgi:hypothetical protein